MDKRFQVLSVTRQHFVELGLLSEENARNIDDATMREIAMDLAQEIDASSIMFDVLSEAARKYKLNPYKVAEIQYIGEEGAVEDRQVKVTLVNGSVITIEACYESFRQYGGTEQELWATVPVAEKVNDWLHGIDLVIM